MSPFRASPGFTERWEHFDLDISDGVATVRLSRPDKLNALTFDTYADLRDLLGELPHRDDVRVLVVTGSGPEVPDHGISTAREHREPDELVHCPRPDVGRGHVPDVREVEREQRPERRRLEGLTEPAQPLAPKPVDIDSLFPVDGVRTVCADRHGSTALPQRLW